jgi:hypothetical protein
MLSANKFATSVSASPSLSLLQLSSPTDDDLSPSHETNESQQTTSVTIRQVEHPKYEEDYSEQRTALLRYIKTTKIKNLDGEYISTHLHHWDGVDIIEAEKIDAVYVLEQVLRQMNEKPKKYGRVILIE